MSHANDTPGSIRKLWPAEAAAFRKHLLRLDRDSRRARFTHGVSDAFIEDYAERHADFGGIVFAYIEGAEVRGVAELRKLGETWGHEAEAAFSVEKPFQDQGIGSELMGRVIRAARNRGVRHLVLGCLAENGKMQAIARRHDADLRFEYGEVIGRIVPEGPNYFSILEEAIEDRNGYMMAVFDLQVRALQAA